MKNSFPLILLSILLSGCSSTISNSLKVDYLIKSGSVYTGESKSSHQLDIGICGERICFVGENSSNIEAKQTIDAAGKVVTPGFIDPHTHSLSELLSEKNNHNFNYLSQGVTTVITGNDGGGTYRIKELTERLSNNGIGTNVGFLVGHGAVRKSVMSLIDNNASEEQIEVMKSLVQKAMDEGAFGLSSGLYYVPGSYANQSEVVELAKVAKQYNGFYDSHIRDESNFNQGIINAIKELISIAEQAEIPAHIAHIKALGVDVWGKSEEIVELINSARSRGVKITADQYPWLASGTFLHNAVVPSWVMSDSSKAFKDRLNDARLIGKIKSQIKENIRRRGGGEALLVTMSRNPNWQDKTLTQIATEMDLSEVDVVVHMIQKEKTRVASFNMNKRDVLNFMVQPWVVTSSDGTDGHPRKFASFPQKYYQYILKDRTLSFAQFVNQSSGKTAKIIGIEKRGVIKEGYFADLNIIHLEHYKPNATFAEPKALSSGIDSQWVNGILTIDSGNHTKALAGKVLLKQ